MSSWTPTTYKTRNWAEYNHSLKQRGSLSIWFDPEMALRAVLYESGHVFPVGLVHLKRMAALLDGPACDLPALVIAEEQP